MVSRAVEKIKEVNPDNLEIHLKLLGKYLHYWWYVFNGVLKEHFRLIKALIYLLLITFILQWAYKAWFGVGIENYADQIIPMFGEKTFFLIYWLAGSMEMSISLLEPLNHILIYFVAFYIGIKFGIKMYEKPYKPMLNEDYLSLTDKISSYGIYGKHANGVITFDWDEVLDQIGRKINNNPEHDEFRKLYNTIVKHYWYLKSVGQQMWKLNSNQ
ncbi:MAG: hypothetical protein FH756_00400 [Firmicutes bacterium]|nr:hypothetical protein [Bacillota bacterium]